MASKAKTPKEYVIDATSIPCLEHVLSIAELKVGSLNTEIRKLQERRQLKTETMLKLEVLYLGTKIVKYLEDKEIVAAGEDYPANALWTFELDQKILKSIVAKENWSHFGITNILPEFKHWYPSTSILKTRLKTLVTYYGIKLWTHQRELDKSEQKLYETVLADFESRELRDSLM